MCVYEPACLRVFGGKAVGGGESRQVSRCLMMSLTVVTLEEIFEAGMLKQEKL